MSSTIMANEPVKNMNVSHDAGNLTNNGHASETAENCLQQKQQEKEQQQHMVSRTTEKPKQRQMSLEFFTSKSPMRRKLDDNDITGYEEQVSKKPKIDNSITNPILLENNKDADETEESIDQEIMDLATESDHDDEESVDNHHEITIDTTTEVTTADISGGEVTTETIADNTNESITIKDKSFSEIRSEKREQERELKKTQKKIEEEAKREARRLKKLEEAERRRIKKEKEEKERRIKREKIEAEREAKRQQKEAEKLERQKKREEENKLREEKKRKEEEEKLKRKEETERKRQEKLLEKQKLEDEKEQKRIKEEKKLEKRSITNFFKVKSSPLSLSTVNASKLVKTEPTNDSNNKPKEVTSSNLLNNPPVQKINEFLEYFLPFHLNPNVKIAKNRNIGIANKWDEFIKSPNSFTVENNSDNVQATGEEESNFKIVRSFDILQCLNSGSINEANKLFFQIPIRYHKFYENNKSAYLGTFSYSTLDIKEKDANIKLEPSTKVTLERVGNVKSGEFEDLGPVINYDYESDFEGDEEGEDEGEGEDVNLIDDDEDEEEGEDDEMGSSDIEEFVERDLVDVNDNNDDSGKNTQVVKKRVMGPIQPVIRNIKEEISSGDEFGEYFTSLRWEQLNENIEFPIDPFKDYWQDRKKTENKDTVVSVLQDSNAGKDGCELVKKEKNALGNITNIAGLISSTAPAPAPAPAAMAVKKKVITDPAHLEALLDFIDKHKSLSLNTLAELAVKDSGSALATYSRAVVKNTVRANASFDKKNGWVVSRREKTTAENGKVIASVPSGLADAERETVASL